MYFYDIMTNLYHKNGVIAWNGTRGFHDNTTIAWIEKHEYYSDGKIAYQGKYAYHNNGTVAWNGTTAFNEDGSYAGSEGIKLKTGNNIYIHLRKNGFELNILESCVLQTK